MANIEPFDYQKRTNIEEHNQLVNKVNEIVTVINDVNLDTINSEIDNLSTRADKTDSDLASVQAKDIVQDSEIAGLKPRVDMTESEITNLKTRADKTDSDLATVQAKDITQDSEIDGIIKSLVSDVIMSDGTTMGSVQVSIKREDDTLITSKNFKWGRDIGIRLEAGTQAGYVKAVIDLSDGTVLESNEYRIVEVLESDIYVTAITLVANQTDGTLGGNISYSNGTTQTINNVSVPTAPGVTSALESLQSRMTAVEQKNTTQDGQITALDTRVKAIEDTPGVGQFETGKLGTIAGSTVDGRIKAETDGTGSVNGWSTLKDRVTATEGHIVTAQNDIADLDGLVAGKVEIKQGAANVGKALVVGSDGNVTPGEISSGKSLYTGNLDSLITRAEHSAVVIKEFDIEYIYCTISTIRTARVTISKGTYSTSNYNLSLMLGVSPCLYNMETGGAENIINVSYYNALAQIGGEDKFQHNASQLTTETVSVPSSGVAYYFRLYV